MGRHLRLSSPPPPAADLLSPFPNLDGLDRGDFREAAYEVFFTACRSTPGFGGRNTITFQSSTNTDGDGNTSSPVKRPGVGMAVTSRIKTALGLRTQTNDPPNSRRTSSCGSNPMSPVSAVSSSPPPPSVLKENEGRF